MISHLYYSELCMTVDGLKESDLPGIHEYYTRMCVGAEIAVRHQRMQQQQQASCAPRT